MTKPVTLSNAAYDALLKAKGKDMSFSDAVIKLVEASKRNRNFTKLAGSLKPNSKELEELKRLINEDRTRNVEET